MEKLEANKSVLAIFGLCSDVTRLTVHGVPYFYLKPHNKKDLPVIKYVLRKNGISGQTHNSRYYGFGDRCMIVRTPVNELEKNQEFKRIFEYIYNRKEELLFSEERQKDIKLFCLWPSAMKRKLISNIAERVK